MGEMITKPGTNAIVVALLNFFIAGCAGYFFIGQTKKGIITLAVVFGVSIISCGMLAPLVWLFALATTYDGYLLGQKLQAGESIGEVENGLEFLNAIFK